MSPAGHISFPELLFDLLQHLDSIHERLFYYILLDNSTEILRKY